MKTTTVLTRAPYPTSNGRTQWKGTSRPYWPQFTVRTSYAQTLGPMPSDTGNSVPHSSIKNTPAVLTSTLSSAMVSAIFSVIPSKTTNDYGSSTLRMTLDFTSVTKTASREDPSCICHTPTQLWSAETAIVASSPTSNCYNGTHHADEKYDETPSHNTHSSATHVWTLSRTDLPRPSPTPNPDLNHSHPRQLRGISKEA